MAEHTEKPDLEFTYHGSIALLFAYTDAGQAWMDEHLDREAPMWCDSMVVEPRYVEAILEGAQMDGLTVAVTVR